jgi:GNAT superfamily N-acetyltransferase
LPVWSQQNHRRVSRVVVLPDYQGIGIGMRVTEAVGEVSLAEGNRFSITASHPATIAHCVRSPRWATRNVARRGTKQTRGRAVVSFEYLGETP